MLEGVWAPWFHTKGPFFMPSFSQSGNMSRVDAQCIDPAFLLPKFGGIANVCYMESGSWPAFKLFDRKKRTAWRYYEND